MNNSSWSEKLADIEQAGLRRSLKWPETAAGRMLAIDGREYVNFGSNDYLGLATDKRLIRASVEATEKFGTGAGSSRLVTGNIPLYRELETKLAAFKSAEAACVLPTGYMANIALIQALADSDTTFYIDKLVHASIVDGIRLSGAKARTWRHNDTEDLKRAIEARKAATRIIITEAVFSMDGCVAPLGEIIQTAREYGAHLVIDEAHSTGMFGPGGRGHAACFDLDHAQDLVITTFSKGLGSLGGAITGPETAIKLIHNRSRPLIFSTALPPPVLAADIKALDVVKNLEDKRRRVLGLAEMLRSGANALGYDTLDSASQIVPIVVGSPDKAVLLSKLLAENGCFAPPIRPPAVPAGTSRMRLSVTAYHTAGDIRKILGGLENFNNH